MNILCIFSYSRLCYIIYIDKSRPKKKPKRKTVQHEKFITALENRKSHKTQLILSIIQVRRSGFKRPLPKRQVHVGARPAEYSRVCQPISGQFGGSEDKRTEDRWRWSSAGSGVSLKSNLRTRTLYKTVEMCLVQDGRGSELVVFFFGACEAVGGRNQVRLTLLFAIVVVVV